MSRRSLALIILLATASGFVGGVIGGAMTGDIHIYIDSFTGPGHYANNPDSDEIAGE